VLAGIIANNCVLSYELQNIPYILTDKSQNLLSNLAQKVRGNW